jgi:hypothetical protein
MELVNDNMDLLKAEHLVIALLIQMLQLKMIGLIHVHN